MSLLPSKERLPGVVSAQRLRNALIRRRMRSGNLVLELFFPHPDPACTDILMCTDGDTSPGEAYTHTSIPGTSLQFLYLLTSVCVSFHFGLSSFCSLTSPELSRIVSCQSVISPSSAVHHVFLRSRLLSGFVQPPTTCRQTPRG